MNINASIIGANGYTGLELINILICHPDVTLKYVTSRSDQGKKVSDIYPSLFSRCDLSFSQADYDKIAQESDIVFLALPHGASAAAAKELYNKGTRIIDLSADFRYQNLNTYEDTYKTSHPCPELNSAAVYGLSEIYREQIKKARIVANPGCYTTAAIVALYPLLEARAIRADNIIIDAKSGITGAGRKSDINCSMSENLENFKAYSLTNHRHTSEIEEQLSKANKAPLKVNFSPHLLPVKRGILATIYCDLFDQDKDIKAIYDNFYQESKFISVLEENRLPELKNVTGSNYVQIGFIKDKRLNKLIVVSCLDNLVKGASGQAVQNMNIMFGIEESRGLDFIARYL
ncbi:MAG: N-acetyl-gamma-glutamyl-phosphate reductase [Bacillota bacterium]|jgi:N-acetyl-gamma-glutamyl-phosphate reductase|nr:N-acetyl-gamma-glutamyl-phosphate reductase [Bacillota bacterium]